MFPLSKNRTRRWPILTSMAENSTSAERKTVNQHCLGPRTYFVHGAISIVCYCRQFLVTEGKNKATTKSVFYILQDMTSTRCHNGSHSNQHLTLHTCMVRQSGFPHRIVTTCNGLFVLNTDPCGETNPNRFLLHPTLH